MSAAVTLFDGQGVPSRTSGDG